MEVGVFYQLMEFVNRYEWVVVAFAIFLVLSVRNGLIHGIRPKVFVNTFLVSLCLVFSVGIGWYFNPPLSDLGEIIVGVVSFLVSTFVTAKLTRQSYGNLCSFIMDD